MATINVKDAAGLTVALEKPLTPGQTTMATSRPVAVASDQSDLPVKPGSSEAKTTAATMPAGGVGFTGWLSALFNTLSTFTKGAGASDATTLRVTLDSGQMGTLGQAVMTGSAPVVLASDQSAIPTYPKVPATANGETSSRVNAAATTNATSLKASAGNIANIDVFNVAAYDVYLKFYNKASAPTVGTDTPVWTVPIKAGQGYARSFPSGKSFATGIAYAITKLQADADTTVLVASDVTGAIDWI